MKKTALIAICLFCLVNLSCGETEVQKVKRLAESGDAKAQFNLGNMYYQGEDVPQYYAEAGANGGRAAVTICYNELYI